MGEPDVWLENLDTDGMADDEGKAVEAFRSRMGDPRAVARLKSRPLRLHARGQGHDAA
ncbi:MAG TPA: hypothetical protein VFF07_09670 [Actinomycetota bacterium]|nr:hypothetical protein [Actinomycetota bacterium]